ncbi:MAG: transposase [Candidatus Hadarchaeum sp.]
MRHRYSHAMVIRITEVVQERVQTSWKRNLELLYAVIYLDALFVKALCPEVGIHKEAVHVAFGVTQEGQQKFLGYTAFPKNRPRSG